MLEMKRGGGCGTGSDEFKMMCFCMHAGGRMKVGGGVKLTPLTNSEILNMLVTINIEV